MNVPPPVDAMVWPVKSSFRGYVAGIGGRVTCSDGCLEDADGFRFAAVSSSDPSETRFEGRVRFTAHDGLLDVVIRDPWLVRSEAGIQLTIAADDGGRRVLAHGPATAPGADTVGALRLTADAAVLFDFTYPPETPLDPVRLIAR